MWKFLLDPSVQAVLFVMVLAGLGYVVYDLYEDTRDPAPAGNTLRRRARAKARKPDGPAAPREGARETAFVEPSVEIWTDNQGETRGRVRRGPCRGMRLEDMTREQCEAQNTYCREHDYPAAVALEAYIRQRFSGRARNQTRFEGAMTRTQAFAELGLSEGASEGDIHAAYRTLIKKHHPDHGGSHAKAARINQAKDLLAG
jgi:hypothetical protein